LYPDELDVVEERERSTKGRAVVLARLAELREESAEAEPMPAPAAEDEAAWEEPGGAQPEEEFFPIADYDDLTVGEILPLLPELYPDELDVVEERERSTKGRAVVLARLAELREESAEAEPMPAPAAEDEGEWEVPDEGWAPRPTDVAVEDTVGAEPVGEPEEEFFPIAGYDELRVPEIRSVLPQLTEDELEQVRAREVQGANRVSVLAAIDRELGVATAPRTRRASAPSAVSTEDATEAGPTRKRAAKRAATRAPAKKAAATKAPSKKAAATKAPVKKAPSKKAASKRTASATPVTETVAKKSPTRKKRVSATETAAQAAAAPTKKAAATKKAAPTKKAAATKAPPTKKAAATKKAATKKAPATKKVPATKKAPATRASARR
ncbi:MAG: hypothetical protein M3P97_00430, partial [Actinomycetota bacterium]|nr:hypothetical protein [Actinomycetota bacterium]